MSQSGLFTTSFGVVLALGTLAYFWRSFLPGRIRIIRFGVIFALGAMFALTVDLLQYSGYLPHQTEFARWRVPCDAIITGSLGCIFVIGLITQRKLSSRFSSTLRKWLTVDSEKS